MNIKHINKEYKEMIQTHRQSSNRRNQFFCDFSQLIQAFGDKA